MNNTNIQDDLNNYKKFFPDEEADFKLLEEQIQDELNITKRSTAKGHVTASGLVLKDDKIILIFHNKFQKFIQPGGHVEDDKTLWQSALREVEEETGLKNVTLHPWHKQNNFIPLHIDTHSIPYSEKKQEAEHVHHDFAFVFKVTDDVVTLQEAEVSDFKWIPVAQQFNENTLRKGTEKIRKLGIL